MGRHYSPLLLCAVLAVSICVNAWPQQQPLAQSFEELALTESSNLPLVVWHGLGDK